VEPQNIGELLNDTVKLELSSCTKSQGASRTVKSSLNSAGRIKEVEHLLQLAKEYLEFHTSYQLSDIKRLMSIFTIEKKRSKASPEELSSALTKLKQILSDESHKQEKWVESVSPILEMIKNTNIANEHDLTIFSNKKRKDDLDSLILELQAKDILKRFSIEDWKKFQERIPKPLDDAIDFQPQAFVKKAIESISSFEAITPQDLKDQFSGYLKIFEFLSKNAQTEDETNKLFYDHMKPLIAKMLEKSHPGFSFVEKLGLIANLSQHLSNYFNIHTDVLTRTCQAASWLEKEFNQSSDKHKEMLKWDKLNFLLDEILKFNISNNHQSVEEQTLIENMVRILTNYVPNNEEGLTRQVKQLCLLLKLQDQCGGVDNQTEIQKVLNDLLQNTPLHFCSPRKKIEMYLMVTLTYQNKNKPSVEEAKEYLRIAFLLAKDLPGVLTDLEKESKFEILRTIFLKFAELNEVDNMRECLTAMEAIKSNNLLENIHYQSELAKICEQHTPKLRDPTPKVRVAIQMVRGDAFKQEPVDIQISVLIALFESIGSSMDLKDRGQIHKEIDRLLESVSDPSIGKPFPRGVLKCQMYLSFIETLKKLGYSVDNKYIQAICDIQYSREQSEQQIAHLLDAAKKLHEKCASDRTQLLLPILKKISDLFLSYFDEQRITAVSVERYLSLLEEFYAIQKETNILVEEGYDLLFKALSVSNDRLALSRDRAKLKVRTFEMMSKSGKNDEVMTMLQDAIMKAFQVKFEDQVFQELSILVPFSASFGCYDQQTHTLFIEFIKKNWEASPAKMATLIKTTALQLKQKIKAHDTKVKKNNDDPFSILKDLFFEKDEKSTQSRIEDLSMDQKVEISLELNETERCREFLTEMPAGLRKKNLVEAFAATLFKLGESVNIEWLQSNLFDCEKFFHRKRLVVHSIGCALLWAVARILLSDESLPSRALKLTGSFAVWRGSSTLVDRFYR
jgi:hypothetical protein